LALVEARHPPRQQAFLELRQPGNRPLAVEIDHPAQRARLRRLRADEVGVAQLRVGEDPVGAGYRADLDGEDAGQRHAVDAAGQQDLAAGEHHAPAVGQAPRPAALLEAPDGAVGHHAVEDAGVAQLLEVGQRALVEEPGVEPRAAGGLEEIARRDEDQLAARLQVAHALLDEVQIQVGCGR
jgi:hypothetical protein